MAKRLHICDADGHAVTSITAEKHAFLNWRRAWAKTVGTLPKDVAIVIVLEKEPARMLVDSGEALAKLNGRLPKEGATCDIAVRTPDMDEKFAGYDVWRAWRPPQSEEARLDRLS